MKKESKKPEVSYTLEHKSADDDYANLITHAFAAGLFNALAGGNHLNISPEDYEKEVKHLSLKYVKGLQIFNWVVNEEVKKSKDKK